MAFLKSLAGISGEVLPLPPASCCTLEVFWMDAIILQVGLDAVFMSFMGMVLVSVAFRDLTLEKLSGDPCLNHMDDMLSSSELGSHDHHLIVSGLYSLKDSKTCLLVLPVDMEYRPKDVNTKASSFLMRYL